MNQNIKERVQLHIECQNLKNKDFLSKSDPQVWIYYTESGSSQRSLLGKTEVINDQLNPKFSKCIELDYHFEMNQYLSFEVYDIDVDQKEILGVFSCTLSDIMVSDGSTLKGQLHKQGDVKKKRGLIYINGEPVKDGMKGILHCKVKGKGLAKKDFFGLSDPYLTISRCNENGVYIRVFQTEVRKLTLNPKWKTIKAKIESICNGDLDRPLKFQAWDWDRTSEDDFIGEFQASINDLKTKKKFSLHNPKKGKKSQGTIIFSNVSVDVKHSFLSFIQGGCQMELVVAVDFTQSNRPVNDPSSLHFVGNPNQMNQYQHAISSVGDILSHYDDDQLYPAFGFGGEVFNGANWNVSHCFALNGNPQNPNVYGVKGLLDSYYKAVHNVRLYGPTLFSQIIRKAREFASSSVSQQNQKYTILLIITDGIINDEANTIDEIVKASHLPLSIIIVGVGNANFSSMDRLDGDDGYLVSRSGQTAVRDIVQFVPFNQFKHNPQLLASKVLEEVPDQVVEYMRQQNFTPNPPRTFRDVVHQQMPIFQQFAMPTSQVQMVQQQHRPMFGQFARPSAPSPPHQNPYPSYPTQQKPHYR